MVSLTSGFTITLQETPSIHGSMNLPKIECISLKAPITTAADNKFCDIFPFFEKNNYDIS